MKKTTPKPTAKKNKRNLAVSTTTQYRRRMQDRGFKRIEVYVRPDAVSRVLSYVETLNLLPNADAQDENYISQIISGLKFSKSKSVKFDRSDIYGDR